MTKAEEQAFARYSDVERRVWNDAWFQSLSPIPPCGQGLWLFLLTAPELGSLPGLIVMGEAAMAERLKWSLEDFREVFKEVSAKGTVKADWRARVLVVFNAVGRRTPQSPNVIRSWRQQWFDVPECALKRSYFLHLKGFAETLPEGYWKAFAEVFREDIAESDSDSDPDPEHERTPVLSASAPPSQPTLLPVLAPRADDAREVWEHYVAAWRKKNPKATRPPVLTPERRRLAKARLGTFSLDDLKRAIDGLWASDWHVEKGHTSFELCIRDAKHIEMFLDKAPKPRLLTAARPPEPKEPAAALLSDAERKAQGERVLAAMKGIGAVGMGGATNG